MYMKQMDPHHDFLRLVLVFLRFLSLARIHTSVFVSYAILLTTLSFPYSVVPIAKGYRITPTYFTTRSAKTHISTFESEIHTAPS